jgi:PTS system mannitol-specific IIA component
MFERESSVSTYMGNYLAIPHGTYEAAPFINGSALAVIRYEKAIDWDGEPVHFVVGIAGKDDTHLVALGRLAEIFSETETVDQLLNVSSLGDFTSFFHQDAA